MAAEAPGMCAGRRVLVRLDGLEAGAAHVEPRHADEGVDA